jgi:general secretion pathway protein D
MLDAANPERRRRAVAAAIALCAIVAAGCATSSAFHNGQRAEQRDEFDLAVVEYTKAVRANPDDAGARAALNRARVRAAQEHFFRGRRLVASEQYEEALIELQLASQLNPTSGEIDQALRDTRQRLRTRVTVSREGKTELQTLIEKSR